MGGREGTFGRVVELLINVDMMKLHERAGEQVKLIIYTRSAKWVELRLRQSYQWALTLTEADR